MRKTEMELKDSVELMNSADYKDRFKAEYWQNQLRYEKLHDMVIKYEAGTLNFTPTCYSCRVRDNPRSRFPKGERCGCRAMLYRHQIYKA